MPTYVYFTNFLSEGLSAQSQIAPALNSDYWSNPTGATNLPVGGGQTEVYWTDRAVGITDQKVWVVTTNITIGGSVVSLQLRFIGTLASSDVAVQIVAGSHSTGWQSDNTQLAFTADDNQVYNLTGVFVPGIYDDVIFSVSSEQAKILPQIDHVVVLMMENRSLDNLLGWIYPSGSAPAQILPAGSSPSFYDGLNESFYNTNPEVNNGEPVYVSDGTTQWIENGVTISEWFVPKPDPGEEFDHVNVQISADMKGFLTDFLTQQSGPCAAQIMQAYSVAQLPIISTLAKSFAVSDAWYTSVPSQTWPNRGFMQTGSSDGHVNNDDYLPWDITTIFDVFDKSNLSWAVYNNGILQSLTKTMFLTKYLTNETNFSDIEAFAAACAQPESALSIQKLPTFSFVEPNFGVMGNDESYHPPHDVRPGENFLSKVYSAIQKSPYQYARCLRHWT